MYNMKTCTTNGFLYFVVPVKKSIHTLITFILKKKHLKSYVKEEVQECYEFFSWLSVSMVLKE